ncbi:MAG: hypothetical protein PHU72_10695 [Dethiosulfovibrio sp.]|nr:hypothetical protein [Dethiosulfovibrio sp.]
MKANGRRGGYALVMVLIVMIIGGSFVALAFQMVESRNRLGTMAMIQKQRYNSGMSLLENAKFWIHNAIETTGKLPVRISTAFPTTASDLLIRSSDGYVIYDLAYPSLGVSIDASFLGFPRWEFSSFSGSISIGDYSSSVGGANNDTGEGPDRIGVYLIRSFPSEGGGYEVVVAEGL